MSEAAQKLTAPFPWFGGKRRVAGMVWDRFGDVKNYVEPFAGSLAVLLGRPTPAKIETVNDRDCFIANFWRALAANADAVAEWCDNPVNEADLHARHKWIHSAAQNGFIERMKTEPDFYDVKIAGWWVWGLSCWIGDNWCRVNEQHSKSHLMPDKGINKLAGDGTGLDGRRPALGSGNGVHAVGRKIPCLQGDSGAAGRGVCRDGLHRQMPNCDGRGSKGVHAETLARKRPQLPAGNNYRGVLARSDGLFAYMRALSVRLRRVRVCCGDWARIMGPTPTFHCGMTGVFLDPPYGVADRDKVYNHDSLDVAADVRAWCAANGDNKKMRIALCGYDGEHDELCGLGWDVVEWTANGGYGNTAKNENRHRERIWFSPHCLQPACGDQLGLF